MMSTQNDVFGTEIGVESFVVARVNLSPEYKECTAFVRPATVDVNGCTYTITLASTATGAVGVDGASAPIEVTVPTGKMRRRARTAPAPER
jgi:hypothetical protein